MYVNGQMIYMDKHFQDHIEHQVPIQVYDGKRHRDIGFIDQYDHQYINLNNNAYLRSDYIFISRPGY